MKIALWKGHHSSDVARLVQTHWTTGELLILCPPLLRDFSFLSALPEGPLEFHGEFTDDQMDLARRRPRAREFAASEAPVFGVFTSGTMSATPRLVLYSRRNIESSLSAILGLFDRSRLEQIYCFPQPFHVFGLTLGYVLAAHLERPLLTPPGKYSTSSLEHRQTVRERNVLTLGTPTHIYDWARKFANTPPTESYSCIIGGAAVSRSLWADAQTALRIAEPSVGYGCSEASPGITHLAPGAAPAADGDIGRPLPSLTSTLIPETGVEIEGPSLCLGVIQDGRLQTPHKILIRDRLRVHPTGHWIYDGRTDLLLNRGGAKFSLEQIELALWRDLGLQAVATPLPDSRLGHDLGLALQDNGAVPAPERIGAVLKNEFGFSLNALNTLTVGEFPLNESAKLDRRAVARLFRDRL